MPTVDMDLCRELELLERHRFAEDKRASAVQMGVLFEAVMRRAVERAPADEREEGLGAAGARSMDSLTFGHLVHVWGAMDLFESDEERGAFERARDVRNWAAHAKGKGPKWKTVCACIDTLWTVVTRMELLPDEERARIAERVRVAGGAPAAPDRKLGLTLSAWGCSLQVAVGVGALVLVSFAVDDLFTVEDSADLIAPAAREPAPVPAASTPDPAPAVEPDEKKTPDDAPAAPLPPRQAAQPGASDHGTVEVPGGGAKEGAKPPERAPPKPKPAYEPKRTERKGKLKLKRDGESRAGPLKAADVRKALARRRAAFVRCAKRHDVPERVTLELSVASSGRVVKATVSPSDGPWAKCLVGQARRLRFPAFDGDTKTFKYPFRFLRAQPAQKAK